MAKKKRKKSAVVGPGSQRPRWFIPAATIALLLMVGGVALLWPDTGSAPVGVDGTPKVVVDQPVVDAGYQTYDTQIRSAFTLRNEGDAPLTILGTPQVKLVEGC